IINKSCKMQKILKNIVDLKYRLINNSLFESNKNQKDDDGNNALHYASLSGDQDSIKFLIDNNVLFTSNKHGENPLHKIALRVEAHDANVLDYLKQELRSSGKLKNAINEQDENGNTTLHIAAQHGNKYLITKLMGLGASIDIKNNNKNTPLHTAIIYGHSYCINVFFENSKGTIFEIVGIHGRDLVHLAAMYGKYDCLSFLFKKSPNYNINKVTDKGNTALHLVVSGDGNKALSHFEVESRQKCIDLLISEGCEMNSVNHQLNTPLHLAARFSDCDSSILEFIINKLQEKNINLSREFFYRNDDGDNVFHMAARSGNKLSFEKLFNSINLNSSDIIKIISEENYKGETLLHLAASSGNLECIKYVINMMKDKKIDINYQMQKLNSNGENLAHLIALNGEVEFLDFIMEESEMRLNIEYTFHRDKEGNSILHKAALQDKYGSYFFGYLYAPIKRKAFLLVNFSGMMMRIFTI
nr:ankyrin repeat domain-containing protein [Wolbachia endosymbiont of Fragariocoptes setiger]